MNVLVIGNGGREHALCHKISQSPKLKKLYCAPGNAGTAAIAENVDVRLKDAASVIDFCKRSAIDLVVVGPEAPLVDGLVDDCQSAGVRVFGPSRYTAQLEGSKAFSKNLMKKLGIPTADFEVFSDAEPAMDYAAKIGAPIVVKADGLAAGKGVVVAQTLEEAMEAIHKIMIKKIYGGAGDKLVLEQCLHGEEASIIAVTDGQTVKLMASSQDHKRPHDGDKGPNTGGMGAYSPAPVVDDELEKVVMEKVFNPVVADLRAQGHPYKGFLYAGIMVTSSGPQVLEFNVRLGDPETQVILPRLQNDILDLMNAVIDGNLDQVDLQWHDQSSVCVVLASEGYPADPVLGKKISGLDSVTAGMGAVVYHAGTRLDSANHQVVTSGGRVLNVVGMGRTLFEALSKTYEAVDKIYFDNMQYRKDIAHRAIARAGNKH